MPPVHRICPKGPLYAQGREGGAGGWWGEQLGLIFYLLLGNVSAKASRGEIYNVFPQLLTDSSATDKKN